MPESENLQKCSEAFPGIASGDHSYTYEKLLEDTKPKGVYTLSDKQSAIARDNTRTSAADSLVGHAAAARFCGDLWNKSDANRASDAEKTKQAMEVSGITIGAIKKVTEAVLNGNPKWVQITQLSGIDKDIIPPLSDAVARPEPLPPPLTDKERNIYDGIGIQSGIQVGVQPDQAEPGKFWIVAKNIVVPPAHPAIPSPRPINPRPLMPPRVVLRD